MNVTKNRLNLISFVTKLLALSLLCVLALSMTACATGISPNNTSDTANNAVDNQLGAADQQTPQFPQEEQQPTHPTDDPEVNPPSEDDIIAVSADAQWLIGRWAVVAVPRELGNFLDQLTPFFDLRANGDLWEGSYLVTDTARVVQEGTRIARINESPIENDHTGTWALEGNRLTHTRVPRGPSGLFQQLELGDVDVVSEDKIRIRIRLDPDNYWAIQRFAE